MSFYGQGTCFMTPSESEIQRKISELRRSIREKAHQSYFAEKRSLFEKSQPFIITETNENKNTLNTMGMETQEEQRWIETTEHLPPENYDLGTYWENCCFDDPETFSNLNKLVGLYNSVHCGGFNYTDLEIIHILIRRIVEEIEYKANDMRANYHNGMELEHVSDEDEGRIFMMILIYKELEQLLKSKQQSCEGYRERLMNITQECQALRSQIKIILGINTVKAIEY